MKTDQMKPAQDPRLMELLMGKLETLERRMSFLVNQLKDGRYSPNSGPYLRAELSALGAATHALRLYHHEVEGLPTPIAALRELLNEVEGYLGREGLEEPSGKNRALTTAIGRASLALAEFDAEFGEKEESDHGQKRNGRAAR